MQQCAIVKLPLAGADEANVLVLRRGLWRNKVYIGKLDKLPPSRRNMVVIQRRWNQIQLDYYVRGIVDRIGEVIQSKGGRVDTEETMIELDLQITGYGGRQNMDEIQLVPTVWLRCGGNWVRGIAEKRVKNVDVTSIHGLRGKIEVSLDSELEVPVFAADHFPTTTSPLNRGFELPQGYKLHLNSQRASKEEPSACGLACAVAIRSEDGEKYSGICRVGGVLEIKNGSSPAKILGVTAAHAILDNFLAMAAKGQAGKTGRVKSTLAALAKGKLPLSPGDVGTAIAWEPIEAIYAVNWLGGGWETQFRYPFPVAEPRRMTKDADFALLELPTTGFVVENTYCDPDNSTLNLKRVTWILEEDEITSAEVDVILGRDTVVKASLLALRPCLYVRGIKFPTMKIQLLSGSPLAPGSSGCWVVQNGGLCGMVVACYKTEPFAHIITAEKMINDIKKTLGNHVRISLPVEPPGATLNITSRFGVSSSGTPDLGKWPDFVYTPLPKPGMIRLVRLKGSIHANATIYLEIFEVDLADTSTKDNQYEVVSWCRDSDGGYAHVLIEHKDKTYKTTIRRELEIALRYLREKDRPRTLWVNAVCLNLKDDEERAQHIGGIFKHATSTRVWLGERDDASGHLFHLEGHLEGDTPVGTTMLTDKQFVSMGLGLAATMQRGWFLSRWAFQEVLLARNMTLHCGDDSISWVAFAYYVKSLLVGKLRIQRLLNLAAAQKDADGSLRSIPPPNFFRHIETVGAGLLVSTQDLPFRGIPFSLESRVSTFSTLRISDPRDAIYALLAVSYDTMPFTKSKLYGIDASPPLSSDPGFFRGRKPFAIDYARPYPDVCWDFLDFVIRERANMDPFRALNIFCQPWAPDSPKKNPHGDIDLKLPSWVGRSSNSPFTLYPHPGTDLLKAGRSNADPLVGRGWTRYVYLNPSFMYNASRPWPVDLGSLKCRKRLKSRHYSLYVRGFILDEVDVVLDASQRGNIPRSWLDLAGWQDYTKNPPAELWLTLIGSRVWGGTEERPSQLYSGSCRTVVQKGGVESGSVSTEDFINNDSGLDPEATNFCREVQSVIWGRRLFRTKNGSLGLARDPQAGDKVCILYGCGVPVILRRFQKGNTPDETAQVLRDERFDDAVDEIFRPCVRRMAERRARRLRYARLKEERGDEYERMIQGFLNQVRESSRRSGKIEEKSGEDKGGPVETTGYTENAIEVPEMYYEFIGEAYVHGMMEGEAVKGEDLRRKEVPAGDTLFELR